MTPKGGDGRSEGAGVCALNVPEFGNTSWRGGRVKEGQRWGWRSCACAACMAASKEEGEGG